MHTPQVSDTTSDAGLETDRPLNPVVSPALFSEPGRTVRWRPYWKVRRGCSYALLVGLTFSSCRQGKRPALAFTFSLDLAG